jgi:hypothetical protein
MKEFLSTPDGSLIRLWRLRKDNHGDQHTQV